MALSLTIPIDEIPESGQPIKGELPPQWLAESLLDAYEANSPVEVDLKAKRFDVNVYLEGTIRAELDFLCSRTLKPGKTTFELRVAELFQPASAARAYLGADDDDGENLDDELRTYSDKKIDFEPTLRELIVLAQDPFPKVDGDAADSDSVAWQSDPDQVHPRWAALQNIKLTD